MELNRSIVDELSEAVSIRVKRLYPTLNNIRDQTACSRFTFDGEDKMSQVLV